MLPCEVSFIFGNKTVALTWIRNQIRNCSFNVHYVIDCPWWSLSDIGLWKPKSQSLNVAPSFVKQVVVGCCITEMGSREEGMQDWGNYYEWGHVTVLKIYRTCYRILYTTFLGRKLTFFRLIFHVTCTTPNLASIGGSVIIILFN